MNNYMDIVLEFFHQNFFSGVVIATFREMNVFLANIDWLQVIKIAIFIALAVLLTVGLLIANDKVFDYFNEKRIKRHHLMIRNNGNIPSIFLLRTVDLPKQLAVRFRIGDMPMIWVSRKEASKSQPEAIKEEAVNNPAAVQKNSEPGLLPDLKDPFSEAKDTAGKAITTTRKTAANIGRTAGLFAGIIGSVTNLLGIKAPALQEAQGALKDVQQQSNQAIQAVNSKIGTADTLVNQVGSVVPKNPFPDSAKAAAQGAAESRSASVAAGSEMMSSSSINLAQSGGMRDFVFDENVWRTNLGKIDEGGGSLNYAMSKTLEPGESMKIDVDIMIMSESSAPVSLMYKIEVLQIPQTKLQLAAPKEYINGIVIYPKISLMSRILPNALIIAMIIMALQLLAGYSHFIF